jgi:hypothetical protein
MTRITYLVVLFVALAAQQADACQPLPQERYATTEKRVKERFDSVDSVELVTLQRADLVKVKEGGIDFGTVAERAVFRVDRVFKGKSRPGDTLVFTSSSVCAFSVVGNPKFKYVFDVSTGKPVVPEKQWLIYRNAKQRTEITESDLTRPINQAFSDIEILERIAK